jgi:hypothetical protein
VKGRVFFQGGDLLAKAESAPEKITPADFRLRPDSAGYQAGKDKKDLGADVDLVGPGKAYERWKKTPEYQQWLKDTGHLRADSPRPETKAFVVLGGKGVANRMFDTLVDAVQGASDGDTIEIRGKGPFATAPIEIKRTALTIRAGAGFRPIIELSGEASEAQALLQADVPLVLEGLELRRLEEQTKPGSSAAAAALARSRSACLATKVRTSLPTLAVARLSLQALANMALHSSSSPDNRA